MTDEVMKIIISAFLFLLIGCTQSPKICSKEEMKGKKVVLFVPGLYGSALVEKESGDQVFITLGQALWGMPLAMHGKELSVMGAADLVAGPMLNSVSVIPNIYSFDVYGQSLKFFESFGSDICLSSIGYDWRDSHASSVAKLGEKIREIKGAGAASLVVAGHSLGAVITAFYLRYGTQELSKAKETWEGAKDIDAAIIAAPPFRGALSSFRDFVQGTAVAVAKRPLSALSVGTFKSFYHFLPPKDSGSYRDDTNNDLGEAAFTMESWKKWHVGLFSESDRVSEGTRILRENYTRESMAEAEKFSQLLLAPSKEKALKRIPLLVIVANGVPTLSSAIYSAATNSWHFEDKADGDGLVSVSSATIPEAWRKNLEVTEVTLPMPHRGMYTQPSLQLKVKEFLKNFR